MAETPVIETRELRKSYGAVEALRGLTLEVPAGSIYAVMGRNGAGKTTALKILLGMARPTSGAARVFGLGADDERAGVEIRRRTGFVSEEKDLYEHMSVEAMVHFTAGFFPRWRADLAARYLRDFDLPPKRKVKALSRGMRGTLALLLALCRGAELLILDEPTAGLDPAMAEEVLKLLVAHVAGEGATVCLASHHIAEVEQVADHVAIVDRGRAVLAGGLDDLRQRYCRIQLVFEGEAPADFKAPGVARVRRSGRVLTVVANGGAETVLEVSRATGAASVEVTPLTLKDVFLEAVGAED